MKVIGVIGALVFAMGTVCAAASTLEAEWRREDLSLEERTALVERSEGQPFEEVAPLILRMLVDYEPSFPVNIPGETPWDDDRLRPRAKTYVMAFTVWNHFMRPRDDPPTAKVVLSLLQKASTSAEKTVLIVAIWKQQWCPDAEEEVWRVARNDEEDLDVRTLAVTTLLYRRDINTYMPLAMQLVSAHEKGMSRCRAFDLVTGMGNRLFKLSRANRQEALKTGFGVLEELAAEDSETGYFMARRLGFLLRAPNEFAPDQKNPKYRGEHGLKSEFFAETVQNALKWYAENMTDTSEDKRASEQASARLGGKTAGEESPAEGG